MIKSLDIKNVKIGEGKPKIAVTMAAATLKELKEVAKEAAESKCDIAEWRADYFEDVFDYNKVREAGKLVMEILKDKPVIFTFRTIEEGGEKAISLSQYKSLLRIIAEDKLADIIDVEAFFCEDVYINDEILSLIDEIHSLGCKVIASNHNFLETPNQVEIVARYMGMQKLGADIVKIAVMPTSVDDVVTLLSAASEMSGSYAKVPLVAISMGRDGMLSRIGSEFVGSAISFASIGKTRVPGQINVNELFIILDKVHRAYGNYSGSEIEENLVNIFLVGFMGTGKSAVAKVLSDIKGMNFVDVDKAVTEKAGKSISKIFEESGEQAFRDLESEVLKEVASGSGQIIACGGGIVLRDENIEEMKKHGQVIMLTASPKVIYGRIKYDRSRPLLNSDMSVKHIADMMEARQAQYDKAADIVIDTSDMQIQDVCSKILDEIKK